MATYYLRTDGNDSNTGLGQSPSQAWRTFRKAASSTGIGSGDTLYIAPGDYRDTNGVIPIDGTYSTTTRIIGNPTGSEFTGVTSGRVLISNRSTSDVSTSVGAGSTISITLKSNLIFESLIFECSSVNSTIISLVNCTDLKFDKCIWAGNAFQSNTGVGIVNTGAFILASRNYLFTKCIMYCSSSTGIVDSISYAATGSNYDYNLTLDRCLGINVALITGGVVGPRGLYMVNCDSCSFNANNSKGNIIAKNCVNLWSSIRPSGATWMITQGANTVSTGNAIENSAFIGTNSFTYTGYGTLYQSPYNLQSVSENRLFGISPNQERSGYGVYLHNAGTLTGTTVIPTLAGQPGYSATGVPTTDMYGNPWSGNGTPHIGAYNDYSLTSTGQYNPTERNSSTITIAPGETSRSLYLYLGVTGLTHTTTNLSASYTRNGQASVPITLVAQTPTGSYVSGGFCEVSAPYARGTYRLDVPNAAFDFGADDVTIFVGGANTTNGAVVTCNMQGIAGNIVHIGPFKVIADGLGSDQPLDIVQGVQAPVSVQLVDANENGVDISGATVEAKVYNAIGSLIATYVCVPVYAADGRCTFQLTTLVTNTAGVYNVTLTRTIGGNIVVFGPMKMIVRAN